MRLFKALSKNLKLLFRNRESAYTIIFGPILIILLVSFAFMGASDEYTVRVGTYSEDTSGLSERTVELMNRNNYLVSVYPDNQTCIDSVKEGSTHACMIFSEKDGESVPISFYLDLSRINIVYQIIEELSSELDLQADAIRRQLAGSALQRMSTAAEMLENEIESTDSVAERLGVLADELRDARIALESMPEATEQNSTDLRLLSGYQRGLAGNSKEIAKESLEIFEDARKLVYDLEGECDECPEGLVEQVETFKDDLKTTEDLIREIAYDRVDDQLSEADMLIRYAIEEVELAEGKVRNASTAGAIVTDKVISAAEGTSEDSMELKKVSTRLAFASEVLKGETSNTESIAAPITTSIVSITVADDQLSFAYPYLLILVIMFIGMLLASMLVVTNKVSNAAFRNFTTPTSDGYHVMVGFITAFLIMMVEVLVILVLSGAFIAQPLFLNPGPTLAIIAIAIVLFTFIGMIIGYLSSTQEAAMISSISVGSVLLFVSNLIAPMEKMPYFVKASAEVINPYIVLSELLKKSMLYGVKLYQASMQILVLLVICVVLLVATMLIQRHIKKKYFKQEDNILQVVKKPHLPKPLMLGEAQVFNLMELMDALDKMTRQEFEAMVIKGVSVSEWVEKEIRNKRLARQLRTKNKEKMILRLDKYLKRYGKNIKR